MPTATETLGKDLFADAANRTKPALRQDAKYRAKRVKELLVHLDVAAYLYSALLVQRCGAVEGCRLTGDLENIEPENQERYWKASQEWTRIVRSKNNVEEYVTTASSTMLLEDLIEQNEEFLKKGLRVLKTEKHWVKHVDESERVQAEENLSKMIAQLESEQEIDLQNKDAMNAYALIAQRDSK